MKYLLLVLLVSGCTHVPKGYYLMSPEEHKAFWMDTYKDGYEYAMDNVRCEQVYKASRGVAFNEYGE